MEAKLYNQPTIIMIITMGKDLNMHALGRFLAVSRGWVIVGEIKVKIVKYWNLARMQG